MFNPETNLKEAAHYVKEHMKSNPIDIELINALEIIERKSNQYNSIVISNLNEFSENYHERENPSMITNAKNCPICDRNVVTTICIEHNSLDFSKDLFICVYCYNELHKSWKNKIIPSIVN